MRDTGPPLTRDQISTLERQIGAPLPRDFEDFLLRFNGGRPIPNSFPIRGFDLANSGDIQRFFGICEDRAIPDIRWYTETMSGRIPRGLLPVAGDGSGNIICLSLSGTNRGAVYFWHHETEKSPPTYGNLYFIADSFTDFLDGIYSEDIGAEIATSIKPPPQRSN